MGDAWWDLRRVLDATRRFETMQQRMAPGSLGGRTEVASPVSPLARGIATPATRPAGAGLAFMDAVIDDDGTAYTTNNWHDVPIDSGSSYGEGDAFTATATGVRLDKPGVVLVTATVEWPGNITGERGIRIVTPMGLSKTKFSAPVPNAAIGSYADITFVQQVTSTYVGNEYRVQVWQGSGGNLGLATDGQLALAQIKDWS